MRCVGINDNYTMSVPLEVLPLLAGDFDGDALSILWIINKDVEAAAEEVFSPRYAMYISRNDGMYNNDINHQKDIIIAGCGLIGLSRKYYTSEELAIIHKAQMMDDIYPSGDTGSDSGMLSASAASMTQVNNNLATSVVDFINACDHYNKFFDIALKPADDFYYE